MSDLGWPLQRAASLFGDRVAFGVTYRELADRLSRLELAPGTRVGFLGANTQAHAEAWLGVPAAGGVMVSLSYRLAEDELRAIADDAELAFLVGDVDLGVDGRRVVAPAGDRGVERVHEVGGRPDAVPPEVREVLDPVGQASTARRAADPVAHFHLSNGARIERIAPLADVSERGLRESATLMVNYLYDPDRIEDYHEDYAGEGKRNASTLVRRMARGWG